MSAESFTTRRGTTRIVFGRGSSKRLGNELDALTPPPARVLVVSTPGRKVEAQALATSIGPRVVEVLPIAREHVPVEVAKEAGDAAARQKADAVIAYGGGSAIGLAKAIALSTLGTKAWFPDPPARCTEGIRVVAVPTTYSGSEVTPLFGLTDNGVKKTGRDEKVRPVLVVYDPDLTDDLPLPITITSLWNALAHSVETLWSPVDRATLLTAEESVRLLARALRRLASNPKDREARNEALEGSYLAGVSFADVQGGIHHKICHVLGGLGLPHAATHAALLPHITRWMSKAANGSSSPINVALAALGRALAGDAVTSLESLARATGAPRSLGPLGLDARGIDKVIDAVLANPPAAPRSLDRENLKELLLSASSSTATATTNQKKGPLVRGPETIETQPGFGSTHDSEALPGALPRTQNTPRPSPYGLYPELLSGTPFTVKNALNSRMWMYRVRPSFSHGEFRPFTSAPHFTTDLEHANPNRTRWNPLEVPTAAADFIDGMVTLGGDGEVTGRGTGYLVNLYAANADMVDRCFSSADGDLLLVPQEGTIDVRTELGWLRAAPGTVILIPRAIKFSVGLPEGKARGWMLEVFGPRMRLPERGPVGSNCMADARHFLAPKASYEDRLCPDGFETIHKHGGRLFTTMQDHSPFDVVAWHGVHVPLSYDLMLFNAIGTTTWDHIDPSIHTVLTAPLDDHGRAVVDFVVFRGRWDVSEHSFRPPFMHRNAASEINGVVKTTSDDSESGYRAGCTFLSPLLTSHGVATHTYDTMLEMADDKHEGPKRITDESLWIMFESALPFRPTKWAEDAANVDQDFLKMFGGMKKRFDPNKK